MKKLLIGGCVLAAGATIVSIVKHHKLNKAFDDAIDNKDLVEARKVEKEIKVMENKVDVALKIAIAVVSFDFALNIIKQIRSNREFNELNFIMILCHILDTDESIDNSDKLDFINQIMGSGKFGEKAIEILKDYLEESMEVK